MLDHGRQTTGVSIHFHANPGQSQTAVNFKPEHLASAVDVADPSMVGLTKFVVTNVQASHPEIVGGLSMFDGNDGPPINTPACGITLDNRDGSIFKHHVVLGAVTPNNPAEVLFTDTATANPDALLEQYTLGAARQKYDPAHTPRHGITKITSEGKDPVYTTAVDGGSPLSILIKSNPQLNMKDKNGEDMFHTVGNVKHHIVKQEALDDALDVLEKHLKPVKKHNNLKFQLHCPNPPNHNYDVCVHGHFERHKFVGDDGRPQKPEVDAAPVQQMIVNADNSTPTTLIPGTEKETGAWKAEPLEDDNKV